MFPDSSGNSLKIDGYRLFYEDRGSAKATDAIVFVHGFPFNHGMWRYQLDHFSMNHRCIAPDLRGFGGSTHLDQPLPADRWTMDVFADDIAALLEHLKLDRVDLCGLSMGGYIAFALWRRHPKRIRRLILADTKAPADSNDARANRYKQADMVKAKGTQALADALLPKLIANDNKDAIGEEVRRMIESTAVPTIIGSLHALAERPDSSTTLAEITVPTLVVVGEKDELTPMAEADFMHDHIDQAQPLAVIPNAGHLSPLENPRAFNEALETFL